MAPTFNSMLPSAKSSMNLRVSVLGVMFRKTFELVFGMVLAIAALNLLLFSNSLLADSLRCKGHLAMIGDKKLSVLEKCGEPMAKDSYCKAVKQSFNGRGSYAGGTTVIVTPCETVEEWSYNPGAGKFIKILLFERGALTSISNGDRVK